MVTVTARIIDNGKGLARLHETPHSSIRFRGPDGTVLGSPIADPQRISGSPRDGVYEMQLTIPADATPGTWALDELLLADSTGNSTVLHADDLAAAGFPDHFTVAFGEDDTTTPTPSASTAS